jgi:hypothetical protein
MSGPPFVETLFKRRRSKLSHQFSTAKDSESSSQYEEHRVRVRFNLKAITTFGWELKVVGNTEELNNWEAEGAPTLSTTKEKYPQWSSSIINFSVLSFPFTFEYKYVFFHPDSQEIRWESLNSNRKASSSEKCSSNYVFELLDTENLESDVALSILNKTDLVQALSRLVSLRTIEDQLQGLTELLTKEVISFNTLALGLMTVQSMKKPIRNDFCSYIKFIDWCSKNLSVQHTKILLSGIYPNHIWLCVNSAELEAKINEFQEVSETLDNFSLLSYIASLRIDLLEEYDQSEDVAGLLITDRYLEKKEFDLLGRAVEDFDERQVWKIVSIGKWITQLLYLQSVRPKQTVIMINQFESIRDSQDLNVLLDLLNELLSVVIELHVEIDSAVNHHECEALADKIKSEYRRIYSDIFALASDFLIKAVPLMNKKLGDIGFVCFQNGAFDGRLWVFKEGQRITCEDCILFAQYVPEDFLFPDNVKGVIVSYIDNLYNPSLLMMKKKGVPICLGYLELVVEDNYSLVLTEDHFSLSRRL